MKNMCMNKLKEVATFLLFATVTGCSKGQNSANETIPKLSFDGISIAEGTNEVNNAEIKLVLDHAYSKQVTVNYTTIEGTAKAGQDFVAATNQAISFQP